jgi:hypothetical protein
MGEKRHTIFPLEGCDLPLEICVYRYSFGRGEKFAIWFGRVKKIDGSTKNR